MTLRTTARTLLRATSQGLFLRRLLRAQEATTRALQDQNQILTAIGRVLAGATNQQWSAHAPARPDVQTPRDDQSGVSYVEDSTLGEIDDVQHDYWDRYGREISDEEAMRVLEDRARAMGVMQ